jgi:hypothetical protein
MRTVGGTALALLAAGVRQEYRGPDGTDVPAIELPSVDGDVSRPKAGQERTESASAGGGADQSSDVSGGAEWAPVPAPTPAGGGDDDNDDHADARDDHGRDDDSGDDDGDDGGGGHD